MLPRPSPRAFDPPQDAVVVPPRAFSCAHYEACLRLAIGKQWPSWTCRGCALCPDDVRLEVLKSSDPPSRAVTRRR
jgi:hypothetical protein